MLSHALDAAEDQSIDREIDRGDDPDVQRRAGNGGGEHVEGIFIVADENQKSAKRQIEGKADHHTVPLLVGNAHIAEDQQQHHDHGRHGMVQDAEKCGRMEERRIIGDKIRIECGDQSARQ